MKWLKLVVASVNAVFAVVLLAIPFGRAVNLVEQELGSAGVIGWLLFFVPLFSATFALLRPVTASSQWTSKAVTVAFLGSFLMAPVALFSAWSGPAQTRIPGAAVGLLFLLDAVLLWSAFVEVVRKAGPDTEDPL